MESIKCKCGSTDYRVEENPQAKQQKAVCNKCNKYIKFIPHSTNTLLFFGKHKGRDIKSMVSDDEIAYLYWLSKGKVSTALKNQIENHLERLK